MVTIEDYDVSECFHHSRSTESVRSTVSETYLSKPSIAKRRANQQETEQFYFMVREDLRIKLLLLHTNKNRMKPAFYFSMKTELCLSYCRIVLTSALTSI